MNKNTRVFLSCILAISLVCSIFVNIQRDNDIKIKNENVNNNETNVPKSSDENQNKPEKAIKDLNSLSNENIVWGPGKNVNDLNQPIEPLNLSKKYKDFDCMFIDDKTTDKNIYLTFDNGYENGYTSKILDVLKEKGVKAIFFITYDYAKNEPDLVNRMITEGHKIGNHTYYHSDMPNVSMEKAIDNIKKLHDYVSDNFGYNMNLFRFPMGKFSKRTLGLVENMNYKTLFWSFAYKDWEENNQMEASRALEVLKKGLHPGAIYLLHSVSKSNAQILGDFIDYAVSQEYIFKVM